MKNVFVYLVSVALLCGILFSFAACGDDNKKDDVKKVTQTQTTAVEDEAETVIVYVTNKKGNSVTEKNGQNKTEVSKVDKAKADSKDKDEKVVKTTKAKVKKKQKTTKFTYKIIDGNSNDPAVVDPF